jgi:glyoxylase-like metal-dependent hydrolase (beta-lactamase superfamily II)
MKLERVSSSVHRIGLGFVNAYLIEGGHDLTVVDTGMPGSEAKIVAAIQELGRAPSDVGRILLTHLHYDHTGSANALRESVDAPVVMHPADAAALRDGLLARDFRPAPRLWARMMAVTMRGIAHTTEPISVEEEVTDGQVMGEAADARVVHVPGHAAGQIALLLPEDGGVLIAADAASRFFRLDYPPIFEDLELGRESLVRLSQESFRIACFGHGRPIRDDAAAAFARRFGGSGG